MIEKKIQSQNKEIEIYGTEQEAFTWFKNISSLNTRLTYQDSLKSFCSFLGIKTLNQLSEVKSIHVINFRDWLIQSGKSPATVNTRLATLSSIFKHLIEKQLVTINPVYGVKRLPKEYRKVKTRKLSKSEVDTLLKTANKNTLIGLRNFAIFTLLFNLGVRRGTVVNLRGKDIYYEDGFLILDLPLKGGKREPVAVNQNIQTALIHYFEKLGYVEEYSGKKIINLPDEAPLFPRMSKNPKLNSLDASIEEHGLHAIWKKAAKKAGIKRSSTHCARVTFATEASKNNCDIKDLQLTLGHSDIRTTQSYIHSDVNHNKSASFSVNFSL